MVYQAKVFQLYVRKMIEHDHLFAPAGHPEILAESRSKPFLFFLWGMLGQQFWCILLHSEPSFFKTYFDVFIWSISVATMWQKTVKFRPAAQVVTSSSSIMLATGVPAASPRPPECLRMVRRWSDSFEVGA